VTAVPAIKATGMASSGPVDGRLLLPALVLVELLLAALLEELDELEELLEEFDLESEPDLLSAFDELDELEDPSEEFDLESEPDLDDLSSVLPVTKEESSTATLVVLRWRLLAMTIIKAIKHAIAITITTVIKKTLRLLWYSGS
jgi:hypothetical protein